jgi:hypothetical protein
MAIVDLGFDSTSRLTEEERSKTESMRAYLTGVKIDPSFVTQGHFFPIRLNLFN